MRVFWGAGKIGRRLLKFIEECDLKVDYFVDNNPALWGSTVERVPVISVKTFEGISDDAEVLITCKDVEAVLSQLWNLGIKESHIKKCNSILDMLDYILEQSYFRIPVKVPEIINDNLNVKTIFDLANGLVLGGVEYWSIQSADKLERMRYNTFLLTNQMQIKRSPEGTEENIILPLHKDMTIWERVNILLQLMVTKKYNNLICNFTSFNFTAACIAKKFFPDKVRLIAVIHNDEEAYYRHYSQAGLLIDRCLVISEKIKKKLLEKNFPKEKVVYLPWEISCERVFSHKYLLNEGIIRIGYAGRIVRKQKRVDYLIFIAEKLKMKGISFLLEIAGNGTYEEELKREIKKRNLQSAIHLLGKLEHNEIDSFWRKQDLMISCSDWEGHSISQCEAMACGAVPIVTDVSGARDDIVDGENGFVVEVGDINQFVDKICFLYTHKELLPIMGEKAYRTIKERNNKEILEKLWKGILFQ